MTGAETDNAITTNEPTYLCTWSEHEENFQGTLKEILEEFPDLNPNEEDWFMWIHEPLALAGYVTGGGVTLKEFDDEAEMWDKVECDNMEIMRV